MPDIELQSALPWGLALTVSVAVALLLAAYGLGLRALPRKYRRWILALRTIFLFVILLLLFDLRIHWTRKVQAPPRIGVFLDNSLSMANHPKTAPPTVFSQVAAVVDWAREYDYQPLLMTFGEALIPKGNLRFEYKPDEILTDFSPLVDFWQTGDLQAGFLFSDGVATSGFDPGALAGPAAVPIFTVGVGDTNTGVDLSILNLQYPLSLLEQEQGRIEVTVRATNAAGRRSRLYIFHEDQLIHSERIDITAREFVQTFSSPVVGRLEATRFRAEVMVLPEEIGIDNNRREFHIDVLPGRREVTILSGALSPNTAFLKQALGGTPHAEVGHLMFLRGGWMGDESKFWSTRQNMVVLDNYPTLSLPEGHVDRLIGKLRRDRSAVLVVEGPDNRNREFVRLMQSLGLEVYEENDPGELQRLIPSPQPALKGLVSGSFGRSDVDIPPSPLVHVLASRTGSGLSAVLTDEQKRPVVGYGVASGMKRSAVLLPALAAIDLKINRAGAKNYFGAILTALVEWGLEPEGFSPYVIQPDRRQYHLGEKVFFRGIMRDRAGTKMLQPVLMVEVQGPESSATIPLTYNFEMGQYEGEFWPAEAGAYRFQVYQGEGSDVASAGAGFHVQSGRVELTSLTQNRYGLKRLAQATGGRYTELEGVQALLAELAYASRTVSREYHLSLWQFRYLLAVLILLLGVEWVLRRSAGLI